MRKSKGAKKINRPKSITEEQAWALSIRLWGHPRAIWRLCCETGARVSDILKLRVREIRHNPITIYESKTGKTREIELTSGLHEWLWKSYGFGDSDNYAFESVRSPEKHYNRMTYHRVLKRASIALKIDFSAHSARKLYAGRIFDRTGDIFAVQKALSHKYVTTTATYLDINLVELIKSAVK